MSNPPVQDSTAYVKSEVRRVLVSLILALALTLLLVNIFLDITEIVGSFQRIQTDDIIMGYFVNHRSAPLTTFAVLVTNMGDVVTYSILIPLFTIVLYLRKHRWLISLEASLILISASLLNSVLKSWISRPRPDIDLHLVEAASFSYPSGHAMSAVAFYGFMIYLSHKYISTAWLRGLSTVILLLLIVGIGASRVYLGVHYPSDVLAGFIAGAIWLLLCILILSSSHIYRTLRSSGSN